MSHVVTSCDEATATPSAGTIPELITSMVKLLCIHRKPVLEESIMCWNLGLNIACHPRQEPFKERDFSIAMSRHGRYVCGQNFFKHNMTWTATGNVPRRQSAIEALRKFHFDKPPATFPTVIVVCVPSGSAPPAAPGVINSVQRISPDEIEMAFVDRLAEVIESNAPEDELKKWRNLCLSCTYEYRTIDNEDEKHWSALQLRQNLSQNEASMKFTTLQLVYDVINDKMRREKVLGPMTHDQVAEGYLNNVKFAETSDKATIIDRSEHDIWIEGHCTQTT